MNDKPVILVALAAALVALTFPFWRPLLAGRPAPSPHDDPGFELPAGQCVAEDMKASHMQLLNRWRDAVVRGEGDASPVTVDGRQYPKSLTRGCMACHTSRENFCARCHEYADVQLTCWNCHVAPGSVAPEGRSKEG